jgi:hypothetical protein
MNYHIFDNVLNNINSDVIRKFTVNVLSACDPILEKIPASSSGKYHPEECCKEGGLLIHIQRACYFGNMFIKSCNMDKLDIKGDIILSALLLHDIAKKEHYPKYTDYVNHPIIGANMLDPFKGELSDPIFNAIKSCVIRHMGPFTPQSHKVPLNKYNMLELIVYQSDYLASQKTIEIVPHSA